MRDVAHDGNRLIVLVARKGNHTGSDAGKRFVKVGIIFCRRVLVGAQHPMGALEHVFARPLDTALLGPGHRMAGNVLLWVAKNVLGLLAHNLLGGAGVGHHAFEIAIGDNAEALVGNGHGRGNHHQIAGRKNFGKILRRGVPFADPTALQSSGDGLGGNVNTHKARIGICVAIHCRER